MDIDELTQKFLDAYDEWAQSPELCGGVLFDAMLEARDELATAQAEYAKSMA